MKIIFFNLFFIAVLSAQNSNCILYLKGNLQLKTNVNEVHEWGIITTENKSAMFSVLDSIWTNDSVAASQINSLARNSTITSSSDGFILNVSATPHFHNNTSSLIFPTPKSVTALYSFDIYNRFGFQFDYIIYEKLNIIYRFETGAGFHSGLSPFSNFNVANGFGVELDAIKYRMSLTANFVAYGGDNENFSFVGVSEGISIKPIFDYKFSEQYFISIGFSYILSNDEFDHSKSGIPLQLGLGYYFK